MEYCRVLGRGLSGAGRQVQHVRPSVVFGEAVHQGLLPGKRAMAVDGSKETREFVRTQSQVSPFQAAAEAEADEPAGTKEDGSAYILFEVDDGMNQRSASQRFRGLPAGPRGFSRQGSRGRHAVDRRMLSDPDSIRVRARQSAVLAGVRDKLPLLGFIFPLEMSFQHDRRGAGPDTRRRQIGYGRKGLSSRALVLGGCQTQRLVQGRSFQCQDAPFRVLTIGRHSLERWATTPVAGAAVQDAHCRRSPVSDQAELPAKIAQWLSDSPRPRNLSTTLRQ